MALRVLFHPQVFRMDGFFIHAFEHLGAQVLQPVAVQVHHAELAQGFDVDGGAHQGVVGRRAVGHDLAAVIDDMGMPAGNVHRVSGCGRQVERAGIGTQHVYGIELRVAPVLDHPGTAAGIAGAGHGHGLAGPVHHLGAVERQRPHRLRVFAVAAADGAYVADVRGFQHGIEGVYAVAEHFHPAVVHVVRGAGAFPAPDMVFCRLVHHVAVGVDHEQGVEEPVVHDLGPARLALADDVGVIQGGQPSQPRGFLAGDIDEQFPGSEDVGQVEDLVGEARQRAFRQGDDLHRHIDVHHGDRGMDRLFDIFQVMADMLPVGYPRDRRGQANSHVGGDRFLRLFSSHGLPRKFGVRVRNSSEFLL